MDEDRGSSLRWLGQEVITREVYLCVHRPQHLAVVPLAGSSTSCGGCSAPRTGLTPRQLFVPKFGVSEAKGSVPSAKAPARALLAELPVHGPVACDCPARRQQRVLDDRGCRSR